MLEELHQPFSIIGLSETKIKIDQEQIMNNKLNGYNFFFNVVIQMHKKLASLYRANLILQNEMTCLLPKWILKRCGLKLRIIHILCGVIYRHPSACLETFMDYLQEAIERIHGGNKY